MEQSTTTEPGKSESASKREGESERASSAAVRNEELLLAYSLLNVCALMEFLQCMTDVLAEETAPERTTPT